MTEAGVVRLVRGSARTVGSNMSQAMGFTVAFALVCITTRNGNTHSHILQPTNVIQQDID